MRIFSFFVITLTGIVSTYSYGEVTKTPSTIYSNSTTTNISSQKNNSTDIHARSGDESSIRFQYEESAEVGNTVWDTHIEKVISHGILQLAVQLQHVFSIDEHKEQLNSNLVFSPANIAAVLAMVMLGSAGTTYREIASVLGLLPGVDVTANKDEIHYQFGRLIRKLQAHPSEKMSTSITIAGALFIQTGYPINEKFSRQSWDIYASEVLNLDFYYHGNEAKESINRWVANRTYGRIPDILEYPPHQNTRVIVASALYFNGAWENPFPPEQTKWKPFYIEGSDKTESSEIVQVIMMATGAELPYYHDHHLGFQVVGLPYKDYTATMYLILPDEPGLDSLNNVENKLTTSYLHELSDLAIERTVIVAVPRMQLESTMHLKPALKSLGINSLFDSSLADLSKISTYRPQVHYQTSSTNSSSKNNLSMKVEKIEFQNSGDSEYSNPGLYAEDIIHKVTVDITETGTEASAASVVSITRDGSHKVVRFERPFLFYIKHKITGIILFWGKVTRPTPNQATYTKS